MTRSLSLILILIPLLVAGSGCKRRNRGGQGQTIASNIYAGDPNVAPHFAIGFYNVEENAWRWTAKDFAVDLSPPLHADERGAKLVMRMAVPDVVIQKEGSVQLSASVQGHKLEPQIFAKSGSYTFTRDIPAADLQNDVARIEFSLDHALDPTAEDHRQLGIIVSEVGLLAK
ncbi:MAG TPA: hypothetical protein VFW44_10960 [Bryobacteraceae bacterium]|nr:hypothetical protein [Bryobacteraceae bacterium]